MYIAHLLYSVWAANISPKASGGAGGQRGEVGRQALLDARLHHFHEIQDRAFHVVDTPGVRAGSLADELATD